MNIGRYDPIRLIDGTLNTVIGYREEKTSEAVSKSWQYIKTRLYFKPFLFCTLNTTRNQTKDLIHNNSACEY